MPYRVMNRRFASAVALLCAGVTLNAQRPPRVAAPPSWQLPRTIDGHPDLQGVWSFATITPLQRPQMFDGRAFVSGDEAAAFENQLLQSARQGPASFTLTERCLRSASGPPHLPGAPDANLNRIVQGGDYVAIVQEKFHETRIVALGDRPHPPSRIHSWVGYSRGRCEGDVLVATTANFAPQLSLANRFDKNLRLVERFSRVAANVLIYEFTADNPTFFVSPWTVRLPMVHTGEEL